MSKRIGNSTNWGGKRDGSGRKSITQINDSGVRALVKAINKRAKLEGKTLDELVLDFAYAKSGGIHADVAIRDRLSAIRLCKELTTVRQSSQEIRVTRTEAEIDLPEMLPDPGKLVVINGG